MASAWGKSWGASWGNSWGNIGLVPDTSYTVSGTRLTNSILIPRYNGLTDTRFTSISPTVSKVSVVFSNIISSVDGLPRYFKVETYVRFSDVVPEVRILQATSEDRFFDIPRIPRSQEVVLDTRYWLVPPQIKMEIET